MPDDLCKLLIISKVGQFHKMYIANKFGITKQCLLEITDFEVYDQSHSYIGKLNSVSGFEIKFSLYPSKEFQLKFLREYLCQRNRLKGKSTESVTSEDIEQLYIKCNKCALVSLFVEFIILCSFLIYNIILFFYLFIKHI